MVLYDSHRQLVRLGDLLGRGGEANVFLVQDLPGWLAKIYSSELHPGYARKLGWMRDHPPDDPTLPQGHASLAWPVDLLEDERGQVRGYLMRHINNAIPLLEVFNPRRRALILPEFDWSYLHRAARNLATALGAVHERGYVVGDLNESNVLVTPAALITLIDTDSFQVRETANGRSVRTHRCPVAKPEYTPPELQGRSLERSLRLPEHDLFGLGVLVFQLLMDGSHPFRAQWLRPGDPPPLPERIRKGCFPYMPAPPCPVAPPPRTPGLELLHPRLSRLVLRCFIDGGRDPRKRPGPEEWQEAIEEAEDALRSCPRGHIYSRHLRRCPHCERARVQVPLSPAGRISQLRRPAFTANPFRRPRASAAGPAPTMANPGLGSRPAAVPPAPRTLQPSPGLRGELLEVLRYGVGTGALVGAALGVAAALIQVLLGANANWILICGLGASAGGASRGWRFGLGLNRSVGGKFGWNRAWQAMGTVLGAAGLGYLGWALSGSAAGAAVGILAGMILGRFLGMQLWLLGDRVGWEQIWTATGAIAGAWLGWTLGAAIGAAWSGDFGASLAGDLARGALAGGTSGALAGLGVDLSAKLFGLST
jgi:DNA-binding helix-hairpin-helix protein with protein kinase domain